MKSLLNAPNRGSSAVYAMIVSALLTAVIVFGWVAGSGLYATSTETRMDREALFVVAGLIGDFQAGDNPVSFNGGFSNGYDFSAVVIKERSPSARLERVVCTLYWETNKPMPADINTASHSLSLVASRLAP